MRQSGAENRTGGTLLVALGVVFAFDAALVAVFEPDFEAGVACFEVDFRVALVFPVLCLGSALADFEAAGFLAVVLVDAVLVDDAFAAVFDPLPDFVAAGFLVRDFALSLVVFAVVAAAFFAGSFLVVVFLAAAFGVAAFEVAAFRFTRRVLFLPPVRRPRVT
ncbi:hypothetical protein FB471_1944 [Amycolatopsis cihanbeyliensis]|uniref:Uncharacterized protein n=2 Tax=Amycolatopsis cihanbeyliensis TaxID=1128664 RepID=A0A542DGN7_AMYCI|nr:hypothetical protein FB471_1944 [Amycolatopsis cihanbeyliensis]